MKALKLRGWVDGILSHRPKAQIATAHWFAVKPVPDMVRATLVIGDERVFTESEVRAIVERIGRANVLPEALYSWSVHVAKEAGVSFDPA